MLGTGSTNTTNILSFVCTSSTSIYKINLTYTVTAVHAFSSIGSVSKQRLTRRWIEMSPTVPNALNA